MDDPALWAVAGRRLRRVGRRPDGPSEDASIDADEPAEDGPSFADRVVPVGRPPDDGARGPTREESPLGETGLPADQRENRADALAGDEGDVGGGVDAAVNGLDTGERDADTGERDADTGESDADTGESEGDAGESEGDAGESDADTGESDADTGESEADAGESDADTGESDADEVTRPSTDEAGTKAADDGFRGGGPPATIPDGPRVDGDLALGDLTVVERIGSGGSALVQRAELPNERPVALKRPYDGPTLGDADAERFRREGERWARFDGHPNVVDVVGVGEDGSVPWIAAEYMDAGSLADRSLPLPPAQAVWTVLQIAEGVLYAHDYGVAHCDLTPSNVLFRATDGDGWPVPKVADWGLSRSALAGDASAGVTPAFAAPEHRAPDRFGEPWKPADRFQIGALLYLAVTGRRPYEDAADPLGARTERPPRPPSEVADVPDGVDEIVARTVRPDDRIDRTVYLRDELAAVWEALSGRDRPETPD